MNSNKDGYRCQIFLLGDINLFKANFKTLTSPGHSFVFCRNSENNESEAFVISLTAISKPLLLREIDEVHAVLC